MIKIKNLHYSKGNIKIYSYNKLVMKLNFILKKKFKDF